VVTLPLTLILQPFVSLSALGVATISIAAVFPYGALLWRAMQAPHPRLRNLLVQGLTLGHASAGGLLISAPLALSAVRLVQLTDVHLGSRGPSVLTHAMKIALAQKPDAIVITGDLVDGGEVGRAELAPLAASPVPIYMVIGNAGVDLMLSGHTHAGQVWPFSHLVTRRHPEWRGLYERAGRHLYVSPGTGCWGPIYRIGSWAEVTVIDLAP